MSTRTRFARLTGVTAAVALGMTALISPTAQATTPHVDTPATIRAEAVAACVRLETVRFKMALIQHFGPAVITGTATTKPHGPYQTDWTTKIGHTTVRAVSGFTGSVMYGQFSPSLTPLQSAALKFAHKRGPFLHVTAAKTAVPLDLGCNNYPADVSGTTWTSSTAGSKTTFTAKRVAQVQGGTDTMTSVYVRYNRTGLLTSASITVHNVGAPRDDYALTVVATGFRVKVPAIPATFTQVTTAQLATYVRNYNAAIALGKGKAAARALTLSKVKTRAAADAVVVNNWAKAHHQNVTPMIIWAHAPSVSGFHLTTIPAGVKVTRPYKYGAVSYCVVAVQKAAVIKAC